MTSLQNIIDKLSNDHFTAVTVEHNGVRVFVNYTLEDIEREYKTPAFFFEFIKQNYPKATIIERRQNGTCKRGNQIRTNYKTLNSFTLSDNTTPYVLPQPTTALNAPAFGLAMPEIIGLNVDRVAKERLEVENEFLKKENQELKKIQDEYREFKLSTQYSENKSKQNTDLITGILNSPVAQEVIAKFLAPKPTAPTLNEPQTPQDDFIKEYVSLDENSKNMFRNALYFSKIDSEFANDFFNLIENRLTKPNLSKV